jgi:transcriptional regulator with PAS, ATPase and Fis domain
VLSSRDSDRIELEHVLSYWPNGSFEQNVQPTLDQDLSLNEMEKHLIENTLRRHNNHKTRTAEILGVTLKTLRNKIIQYEIEAE